MSVDNGFENRETPEELRPIESALDVIAQGERDAAPLRLEQSVFLASYGKLRGEAEEPMVFARIGTRIGGGLGARMRLAAAVGLIGAVAAAWLGYSAMFNRAGGGSVQVASATGLEDDVDFVLDLRSSSDDLAILGERIDSLFLDTTSVGDSLKSDTTTNLMGDGAL
jgi:hypothetical protein